MQLCNYRTSKKERCYYETTFDSGWCYFHAKVEAGFIDGYYEHITNDESRDSRWVSL